MLEAELHVPERAHAAAVLCHPHPQHGGNMRSLVPSVLFEELPAAGIAALRFNFRGVQGSGGSYGGAVDEQLDVLAALEHAAAACPRAPLVLVGWSFGAEVAVAVDDARIAGWVLVALPLRILPEGSHSAGEDPRPKLILQPEHDQYRSPEELAERVLSWSSTTMDVIAGADHFLVGRTDAVAQRTIAFIDDLLVP